jgi:hypothetical protein
MELKLLYGPRPQRVVDHYHIADLILRHGNDDHDEQAERYAEQYGLSTIDLLKIKALLKQSQRPGRRPVVPIRPPFRRPILRRRGK